MSGQGYERRAPFAFRPASQAASSLRAQKAAVLSVGALVLALTGCAGFISDGNMAPVYQAQPMIRPAAAVQVMPGDTVPTLSRRYGVTRTSIIEANSLEAPYKLRPGSTIVVPETGIHVVMPGESLGSISKRYGISKGTILAANTISDPNHLRVGQKIKVPLPANADPTPIAVARNDVQPRPRPAPVLRAEASPAVAHGLAPAQFAQTARPRPAPDLDRLAEAELLADARATQSTAAKPRPKPEQKIASNDPDAPFRPAAQPKESMGGPLLAAKPQQMASARPMAPVEADDAPTALTRPISSNIFVWPVQGRIISGFGPRTNGYHNDGINIAVAPGTHVRAADAGVVVYAGNELAGYGNLLLVRHSNGFVTAYAHNQKLLVGRGHSVKQGQVIAHSGATGDVDKPQLHFEVRRGDRPVDPKRYLQSANASL